MLVKRLRVVFSGYEQEPSPALVRHDNLWEPGEGAAVLQAAEESKRLSVEVHRVNLPALSGCFQRIAE